MASPAFPRTLGKWASARTVVAMTQRRDNSPPARRNGVRLVALGVGFALAIAATVALVVTDDAQYLKLAVVAALWAFVVAALAAGKRAKSDTAMAPGREVELRRTYELELGREVAARREYELRLEVEIRRELESALRSDIEALREDVFRLRTELVSQWDKSSRWDENWDNTALRLERVAVHAESTRLTGSPFRALEDQARRLATEGRSALEAPRSPSGVYDVMPEVGDQAPTNGRGPHQQGGSDQPGPWWGEGEVIEPDRPPHDQSRAGAEPARADFEPSRPSHDQRRHEPPRQEPIRSEPPRRDPIRSEPPRQEPARNEPPARDPLYRSDPYRNDQIRNEPPSDERRPWIPPADRPSRRHGADATAAQPKISNDYVPEPEKRRPEPEPWSSAQPEVPSPSPAPWQERRENSESTGLWEPSARNRQSEPPSFVEPPAEPDPPRMNGHHRPDPLAPDWSGLDDMLRRSAPPSPPPRDPDPAPVEPEVIPQPASSGWQALDDRGSSPEPSVNGDWSPEPWLPSATPPPAPSYDSWEARPVDLPPAPVFPTSGPSITQEPAEDGGGEDVGGGRSRRYRDEDDPLSPNYRLPADLPRADPPSALPPAPPPAPWEDRWSSSVRPAQEPPAAPESGRRRRYRDDDETAGPQANDDGSGRRHRRHRDDD